MLSGMIVFYSISRPLHRIKKFIEGLVRTFKENCNCIRMKLLLWFKKKKNIDQCFKATLYNSEHDTKLVGSN